MSINSIVLFCVYVCLVSTVGSEFVEVKTSSGIVRGNTIEVLNKTINQYLNIPYAEPPVGKLRFLRPVPLKEPITGIIDATKLGNSCFQLGGQRPGSTLVENEDCLYLNIWRPKSQNSFDLKPVMFWIHGGAFRGGSGMQFNGSALATNDVVVVTINYRLGPFGWLYGGDNTSPGNLGLYDQRLALKWVIENIVNFGGNPQEITIFGESAGSQSCAAQILSPLSRGLFKRAILESGSVFDGKLSPLITKDEASKQSKQLAKHFNCTDDNLWLDCLRKVDSKALNSFSDFRMKYLQGTEFLPVLAQNAFDTHSYNSEIEILSGSMKNEGTVLASVEYPTAQNMTSADDFKALVKKLEFHDLNADNITEFYLKYINKTDTEALKNAFYDLYGDLLMTCPTYLFAKTYAEKTPKKNVFFYQWTYVSNISGQIPMPKGMGAFHGSDIPYVFGEPVLKNNTEKSFSADIMKMWTNFAKNSKQVEGFPTGTQWPRMINGTDDNSVIKVKEINPSNPNHIFDNLYAKTCDGFWKSYYI